MPVCGAGVARIIGRIVNREREPSQIGSLPRVERTFRYDSSGVEENARISVPSVGVECGVSTFKGVDCNVNALLWRG